MSEFHEAGKLSELKEGEGKAVQIKGRLIALFLQDGKVYAIDDACPHMGAPLSAGCVRDGIVSCAWHGWRYRVSDGCWADVPAGRGVATYPVKVDADNIMLEVHW